MDHKVNYLCYACLHHKLQFAIRNWKGIGIQESVSQEGLVWFSTFMRVSLTIARVVSRQLATRLPLWGEEMGVSGGSSWLRN